MDSIINAAIIIEISNVACSEKVIKLQFSLNEEKTLVERKAKAVRTKIIKTEQ